MIRCYTFYHAIVAKLVFDIHANNKAVHLVVQIYRHVYAVFEIGGSRLIQKFLTSKKKQMKSSQNHENPDSDGGGGGWLLQID